MESMVLEEATELIDTFKKTSGKPIKTQVGFVFNVFRENM
jgi:hypothetical protein